MVRPGASFTQNSPKVHRAKIDRSVCFLFGGLAMNREEKNALSRQRILEAALEEFSQKGYEAASLSNVCAEKGLLISPMTQPMSMLRLAFSRWAERLG